MKCVQIFIWSWCVEARVPLTFPKEWKVATASVADTPDMSTLEIQRAIAKPIGGEGIRGLAEGKKSAAIVVDDLTRPTQAYRFLP